jgi:peptidyl-prolyl cis-trans isomerase A (cyclophilin A)
MRAHSLQIISLLACFLSSSAVRAGDGDPNHGGFTLTEAIKGLAGPPAGPLQAEIETSKGRLTCRLFDRQAPIAVANFIGLATGARSWLDFKTGKWTQKKPFYDGLTFHRIVPGLAIQGGDPVGDGTGHPGYRFQDEIVPDLKFDRPGLLAMANAGPATNGSQFFITEGTPDHLAGHHTIFGACEPVALVVAIASVRTGSNDRPIEDVLIRRVTIHHGDEVTTCPNGHHWDTSLRYCAAELQVAFNRDDLGTRSTGAIRQEKADETELSNPGGNWTFRIARFCAGTMALSSIQGTLSGSWACGKHAGWISGRLTGREIAIDLEERQYVPILVTGHLELDSILGSANGSGFTFRTFRAIHERNPKTTPKD